MDKNFLKNTFFLYLLTFTKMVLPFITLPYLTRILSVEVYGSVAYVKSIMNYVQLIIDFGFMLSITREIVVAKKENNWDKISNIISITTVTRVILAIISLMLLLMFTTTNNILMHNIDFVILMFVNTFLTIFLMDFLFRGIEKMEVLTYRFLVAKIFSTVFIFIFVKNDNDIILMAYIEIISSLIAVYLTYRELKFLGLNFKVPSFMECKTTIIKSFIFFISNFSTTIFSLFITCLIGIYLDSSDVAYWSLATQIVSGIQSFYSPICSSLYPKMIRDFNLRIVYRLLCIFIPIIVIGCIIIFLYGELIITIIAGVNYIKSAEILNYLIPVIVFSFPAMLFGWPVLGALHKEKEVTAATIVSAVVQVILLTMLAWLDLFTLLNIALTRAFTEIVLLISRMGFVYLHKENV